MLAAVPTEESRTLELFDLALRLIRERGRVPPRLSEHFNTVLSQAKALASDPAGVRGDISPQAIQLARRMRETDALREVVSGVADISKVTPAAANKILTTLGERVAT
jgi:hypothetical protein